VWTRTGIDRSVTQAFRTSVRSVPARYTIMIDGMWCIAGRGVWLGAFDPATGKGRLGAENPSKPHTEEAAGVKHARRG